MKRILLLAVAALMFVGCNNAFEDEGNARFEQNTLPTLTAAFDEDATRTYVENNKYLRWHEGDLISVFYGTTLNSQYKFIGNTGANSGEFEPIKSDNLSTGNALDRIYAVYPYDAEATISDLGVISYSMPATQTYAEESFGRGANVMVAATESVDDKFLSFKNVGGYLKIKLYGEGSVQSIVVKGNNDEKIAGRATVAVDENGVPQYTLTDAAITLDCGEGVELSADAENPTEFWVVVPPTTFESGITITVTDTEAGVFEKSTDKQIAIERNVIQPMSAVEAEFEVYDPTKPAKNEVWYTSTDGEIVTPNMSNVFGATIVSNTYEDGKGIITFDDTVTIIGDWAFSGCSSLTSVTIGDSVTTIGYAAFGECYGLTSVIIGDSVTAIGNYAFSSCRSLTSVTIPNSVTTIGEGAFDGCTSLKEFNGKFATDNGRCMVVDNTLIAYANKSGTEYTIPDSVTTIGGYAFAGCNNLTSVTIPDSVTTIGGGAFSGCSSLTSVTIGDSVITIGHHTFEHCSNLTSITIPDSVTTIGNSAFFWCSSLTSVTIGDSVTTIGDGAFSYCSSLTSVTIPDSVTTIGGGAFRECYGLTSVTIPDSVITIGDYAFDHCSNLTSITIPDSVTTIGDGAFFGCSSLTSVTIPDSVTSIGRSAFRYCVNLTSVYCKATTPPTMGGSVFGDTSLEAIYVPTASVNDYKTADGWCDYADVITGFNF